jgi:thiamine biosynthesis protein ThiS
MSSASLSNPEPLAAAGDCEILLNGDPHHIRAGSTVRDLLDELGLGVERVAVEVDRKIVRRADWDGRNLAPGASVEVVHFVGGG